MLFQAGALGTGAFLVVKRPIVAVRRPSKAELVLLVSSTLVALAMAEVFARLVLPSTLTWNQVFERAIESPEHLYEPGFSVVHDIRGLYQGATEADFRVSQNRFIEPEPQLPARYRVLFLAGSTTDSGTVRENQRWVALLNNHPEIAAYNGAQGGASMLDEYFTFEYLTQAKGMRFDLVILMTVANDFGWAHQLSKIGRTLELANYRDDLQAWYQTERRVSWWTRIGQTVRLMDAMERTVNGFKRIRLTSLKPVAPDESSYVQRIRNRKTRKLDNYGGLFITLDQCRANGIDLEQYGAFSLQNLGLFREAVASIGAELLVLSEPTSYGAPADSFFEDCRHGLDCRNGMISNDDSCIVWKELNKQRLQAARSAGALTFDLASAIDPLTNGRDGGTYMYDQMHYTPEGLP